MRATFLVPLAVAVALAVPAGAEECVPTDADPELCYYGNGTGPLPCDRTLGRIFGVSYYIDNDYCQWECIFSIWFYQEYNGEFWLQRADEIVDNTCGGQIESDLIII